MVEMLIQRLTSNADEGSDKIYIKFRHKRIKNSKSGVYRVQSVFRATRV
jgi:hypothetical protein